VFNKSSAVAEMGDRGHNRHGPKRGRGLLCPFRGELGPEQGMGRWVMGQMNHENRMGHMGHGSLGVDP